MIFAVCSRWEMRHSCGRISWHLILKLLLPSAKLVRDDVVLLGDLQDSLLALEYSAATRALNSAIRCLLFRFIGLILGGICPSHSS